jgi:hypothetical protein
MMRVFGGGREEGRRQRRGRHVKEEEQAWFGPGWSLAHARRIAPAAQR